MQGTHHALMGKKGNSPDSNKDHMQCKWFNLVCTMQETVKGLNVLAEFCKLKKMKTYKQKKRRKSKFDFWTNCPKNQLADGD